MRNLMGSLYLVLLVGVWSTSCASKQGAQTGNADRADTKVIRVESAALDPSNQVATGSNNSMQLVDYLRRVPGLQIDQRGDQVSIMIRGATSISGDNSPLFVINNQAVGNSYADATSAVDVNDIKSVNVIKGPEGQQLYGMRGANGVIQILTKKR